MAKKSRNAFTDTAGRAGVVVEKTISELGCTFRVRATPGDFNTAFTLEVKMKDESWMKIGTSYSVKGFRAFQLALERFTKLFRDL